MIVTLLGAMLLAGGPLPNLPPAERWNVSANATGGSGLSFAGAQGRTLLARSPAFISVDLGFVHPQLPAIEFAPAVLLEIEGRVALGFAAKVRAFIPQARRARRLPIRGFGIVGVPVFVAPFTLAGVQAGAGIALRLHQRFELLVQGTASAFVLGSDLMEDGALGKLDLDAGVRVNF